MRHPFRSVAALLALSAALLLGAAPAPPTAPDPSPDQRSRLLRRRQNQNRLRRRLHHLRLRQHPAQRQRPAGPAPRMLGTRYEVKNFGVNSLTLLNKGDKPYQKNAAFTQAKAYLPDVVIIMLGTNDTKAVNWASRISSRPTTRTWPASSPNSESKPRIFSATRRSSWRGTWGINEADIQLEIPMIDAVAKELKLGVLDVHGATQGHDDAYISDHVHPNNNGTALIAGAWYKTLTGKEYNGPSSIAGAATASRPATAPATK